jgi:hypothetical protein
MNDPRRESHALINIAITVGAFIVSILIWIFSNSF